MKALRLASLAMLVCAVAAACGSTGNGPAQSAPPPTGETAIVAVAPGAAIAGTSTRPVFPAKTAADVIALAQLHPAGTVVYDVTSSSGSGTIRISRLGAVGAVERTSPSGASWVGFAGSKIVYGCTSSSTGDPVCQRGDASGSGLKTAYGIAKLLGSGAIRATFAQFVGSSNVGVGQDTQIGESVSCMALSADNADFRLCATKDGQITQLTAGQTSILATSIATATPKDVAAPTTPA